MDDRSILRSVKKAQIVGKMARVIRVMHLSTKKNRQIEQAKQSDLPKEILKGRLPKNMKSDSKSLYKYVRSKTKVKSTVGPFMDSQGNLVAGR